MSNAYFATYCWQKDEVVIVDSPGIYEGTTTTVLTVFNAQEKDEGDYPCDFLCQILPNYQLGG